jgi:hypothetical protein
LRFKQAFYGRRLPVLALTATTLALVAFAAVALAASRSSAGPPPIHCVAKLPATLDEATCPIQGKTVDVAPVSGVVFFTAPGDIRRKLDEPHAVPITTIVDARRGRFRLTANEQSIGIRNATADFFGGRAEIIQGTGAKNGTVHLQLTGENLGTCGAGASATASRSHHKLQHLWGTGKGHFGITGHYASAIVQGTKWRLTDFCDGSGVTVSRGTVKVLDFSTGKTVLVHAGQSYFAPATQTFVFPTSCPQGNVPFGSAVTITGTFSPPNPTPAPQADYTAPSGTLTRHTLSLDSACNFSDQVTANERGVWSVSVHLANAAPGGTPASCNFLVV